MDVAGDNIPEIQINSEQNGGDHQEVSDVNISDVLEAIGIADSCTLNEMSWPHVEIVEQPAPKGLRFRYECEGRSAGSIPGTNSTPENKTFPTIKIHGYVGPATIIATCITKDGFFVHPHNLVGRNCNQGVCSVRVRITEEAREYQFKNLGIQCVKRRDIATALHNRQERKVDPFQMGFQHANDTSKIDLNAVRLAIQVIVKDNSGRDHSLRPVYTDIIYDKKSTSDLLIMRASHCSGLATGGTQIIILCEKLVQATRDDTVIAFYELDGEEEVWCKEVPPLLVHKQVALVFDTPPYRDPNTTSNVTVRYQLRRRSDQERSNSLPFEYIQAGSLPRKPPPDLAALAAILRPTPTTDDNNNNDRAKAVPQTPVPETIVLDSPDSTVSPEPMSSDVEPMSSEPVPMSPESDPNEHSLDELLEQVAELDEIYSESRLRSRPSVSDAVVRTDSEDFDDAGTYTSLQLAFKNPVDIAEPYEDVGPPILHRGPLVEFAPLKTEPDDPPPLPPKRVRKDSRSATPTSTDTIRPGRRLPLAPARSEPALPPPPAKKRSFLSRLFRRKEKSPAPSVASEGQGRAGRGKPVGRSVSSISGQRPSKFACSVSHTSLRDDVTTAGSMAAADSITHISLHGDGEGEESRGVSRSGSTRGARGAPGAMPGEGTILVAESVLALDAAGFRKLRDELDLTEAEHYALYMAVAPHATVSEFDDTSCYYSPVDASTYDRS